jgi:hypothetical protein
MKNTNKKANIFGFTVFVGLNDNFDLSFKTCKKISTISQKFFPGVIKKAILRT